MGNGEIFEVVGGAAMYVASCTNFSGGCGPVTQVDPWDLANEGAQFSGLNPLVATGTFITTVGNGYAYEVVGGAAMYVSGCSALPAACVAPVPVDPWDLANEGAQFSGLVTLPPNGTFLDADSDGHQLGTYVIAGGSALAVSDCSVLGGCAGAIVIDNWDVTNAGSSLSGLNANPADGTVVEGLPSDNSWQFEFGGLEPTTNSSTEVQVNDAALSSFPLDVAPAVTSADTTSFIVTNPSSFKVAASGFPKSTFSESGNLPSGVTLSAAGTIAGAPTVGTAGTYPITITASNGISPDATQAFTLTVLAMGITATSLPSGTVKAPYTATLTAAGGNLPYRWSLASGSGRLPPGLKLKPTGVISGKPRQAGTYSFTVQVVDTKSKTKPHTRNTATAMLSITIS